MLRTRLEIGWGRRGRAAAMAVVLGVALGCENEEPPEPLPIRLIGRVQGGEARPVTGAVRSSARVGGVRRPVLASTPSQAVHRVLARPGQRVELVVDIPESMQGREVRFRAPMTPLAVEVPEAIRAPILATGRLGPHDRPAGYARVLQPRRRSAAKEEPVVVEVPATGASGEVLVEIAVRPDHARIETDEFVVPSGGRLRFAVAIDPDVEIEHAPPVTASIEARRGTKVATIWSADLSRGSPATERRWREFEVDLGDFAGEAITLAFSGRSLDLGVRPHGVLWAHPSVFPASHEDARRPNVVLISLDTLRADHLGSYGAERPTSPRIDELLARRGAVFEHAMTSFPHTVGSHMTLFTSLDPCRHGLRGTAWMAARPLAEGIPTMAGLLRAAGYETAAFTENAWVTATLGFHRGFDVFVEDSGSGPDAGNVEITFARALAWIEKQGRNEPFFVFIHTYQVHAPHTPPEGYLEKIGAGNETDEAAVQAARYDAEIRYTDEVVGRFLERLGTLGLDGRTLLVLVGDHGEQFGEHRAFGHSNTLFEPLLHVPLILRGPGVPADRRIPDTVGLIDVLPTVLELVGAPVPAGLQGKSVAESLRGGDVPPRHLFAELPPKGLVAVRQGYEKIILNEKRGRHSLYDLASDPAEQRDLAGDRSEQFWAEATEAYRRHCEGMPGSPMPTATGSSTPVEFDAQVRRKLEALGYME